MSETCYHDHFEVVSAYCQYIFFLFHLHKTFFHDSKVFIFWSIHGSSNRMISFFWHLHLRDKTVYFKIVNIIVYFIDLFLVFLNNTLYRFFLALCNLYSHGFKVTWTIDFVIDFTYVFFVANHRFKALFVNRMSTIKSFHHLATTCSAFKALLFRKDLITNDA